MTWVKPPSCALFAVLAILGTMHASQLVAQSSTGSIGGRVYATDSSPVAGAILRVAGTSLTAQTGENGVFVIRAVPAGEYTVYVRRLGFASDSFAVTAASGRASEHNIRLRPIATVLSSIVISAERLGETQAAALDRQRAAANIVTVLPGDEIRSLPNFNAAEAAGRIPGVAIERDEGEGKFIQIRGTEPRLSNVTIDGTHIPGTEQGNRIAKLDAVPSDILAAIEVSKTLTADMDADAIGGSVNLVTKTPEGRPRGYVAGQFGHMNLLSNSATQGGLTYGGRFGDDAKLGLLLGGSIDRNNRGINDVEPSWAVDSTGRSFPNEWSQRDYNYYRTRYGLGGDVDYRFNDRSFIYVKGLWSLFLNHGTRYVTDISTGQSAFADTLNKSARGDSAANGPLGYGTGVVVTREVSQRRPTEQLWGLNAGGKHDLGSAIVDYSLNYGGTRQSVVDYRFSPFRFSGNGGGLTIKYDASNITVPLYQFINATQAADAANPSNFALSGFQTIDGLTTGRDLGGGINVLLPYQWAGHQAGLKVGLRVRDEAKHFTSSQTSFQATGTLLLSQVRSSFSDPAFYSSIASGAFQMGPVADNTATLDWENSNPTAFTSTTNTVGNELASFSGSERIYAGYVMNDADVGRLHVNLGLRLEQTHSSYIGHVASTPTDTAGNPTGPTTVSTVPGSQIYTDLFPSAQFRYAFADNTNLRLAVTRAIARPNYSQLAPSLSGNLGVTFINQYSNLSSGNPNLRPQHAWNFDLLFEHFLSSVGVISGGVFYKRITDFIEIRDFTYTGPYAPFVGYRGTQPQNGGDGHLLGFEADWVEHLTFLPGVLSGLGFDANYTHVSSKVVVDSTGRQAPLLRQAPDLANVAVTYDQGRISSRVAWTYNGANIAGYGDGSTMASGDNYFYAHSQIDASAIVSVTRDIQVQFQVLNVNNAVFGFFNGTPNHAYNFQREYYGQTFFLGTKYSF